MQSWAAVELKGIKLGDRRLQRRLIRIVERLAANPACSVPAACKNWAETKAVYRFWDSDQVQADAIRAAHQANTIERIRGQRKVLVVQDTSELDYTRHGSTVGLGDLSRNDGKGLLVHSALAIQLDGVPLGLLHQEIWSRESQPERSSEQRRATATEEKESQRWISTLQASQAILPEDSEFILVADREADMYDLFAAQRREGAHILIRAVHNRRVVHEAKYLWEAVQAQAVSGYMTVEVGRQPGRPPRTATLEIRFMSILIQPPHNGLYRPQARPVQVQAILAKELSPPEGEPVIGWRLLTTLPVNNLADAKQCVIWYSYRWLIERYHFVLKSGCRVEKLQLESAERLERALATYAIVAWRLLWLTYEARMHGEQGCETALETHEWQALYCTIHRTPHPPPLPPDLKVAVLWIARLGGFLARASDGDPGVQTIWLGLRRLADISDTWLLLHPSVSL